MRRSALVALFLSLTYFAPVTAAEQPCAVTLSTAPDGHYGNQLLAVGPFGLWPDGTIVFKPGGPGFIVNQDGALAMKFGWTLARDGKIQITGRRTDGDAPPLRSDIGGSEDPHFKPSYLIFPSPGCWEVHANIEGVKGSEFTFITRVVKIGDGPAGTLDLPRR